MNHQQQQQPYVILCYRINDSFSPCLFHEWLVIWNAKCNEYQLPTVYYPEQCHLQLELILQEIVETTSYHLGEPNHQQVVTHKGQTIDCLFIEIKPIKTTTKPIKTTNSYSLVQFALTCEIINSGMLFDKSIHNLARAILIQTNTKQQKHQQKLEEEKQDEDLIYPDVVYAHSSTNWGPGWGPSWGPITEYRDGRMGYHFSYCCTTKDMLRYALMPQPHEYAFTTSEDEFVLL